MRTIICLLLGLGLGACATTSAVPTHNERAALRLQKKNALITMKMVRVAFDHAKGEKTSVASLIDYSPQGTELRSSSVEGTARAVAMTGSVVVPCATDARAVTLKNGTGSHVLLLVDGEPATVLGNASVTDFIGPGVAARLCLPDQGETHVFAGGTFTALGPDSKAKKVFYLERTLKADEVNEIILDQEMLRGR